MIMLLPITIKTDDFEAKCLEFLDSVAQTHQPFIITDGQGKAVAKLVPMSLETDLFGALSLADSVRYEGDIVSPLENEWEAAR